MSRALTFGILAVVIAAVIGGVYYYLMSSGQHEQGAVNTPAVKWVIDEYGRNVTIPSNASRIVLAGKGARIIVEAAYTFRTAPRKIIAIDSASASLDLVKVVDPYLKNKTVFPPPTLNAEEVLSLKPDVVILKSYLRSKGGKQLEEAGVPVIYLNMETPENFFNAFYVLGRVFGEEDRASKLVDYMWSVLRLVEEKVSQIPQEGRPRVLLLYYSTKGGTIAFKVPGQSWLQNIIIEKAGGVSVTANLTGSGWSVVNLEQIIQWDPEYLFIVTYRSDPSPNDVAHQILNDPEWQTVTAVREGHVYGVPGGYESWDMPTPKWILCVMWMAQKMHPELFTDIDVRQEMVQYFMTLYNLQEDVAESLLASDLQ